MALWWSWLSRNALKFNCMYIVFLIPITIHWSKKITYKVPVGIFGKSNQMI